MNELVPSSCPNCRQTNFRKVISIVSEGTTTSSIPHTIPLSWQGRTYYFQTSRHAKTVSTLVQRLSPPPRLVDSKRKQQTNSTTNSVWLTVYGILLVGVFPVIMGLFTIYSLHNQGQQLLDLAWLYIPIVIWAIIFIFLPLWMLVRSKSKNAIRKFDYLQKQQQLEEMVQNNAKRKYFRLYYCYVCDSIFDPDDVSRRFVPTDNLDSYIYS